MLDLNSFWLDQEAWPVAHVLVPAALYVALGRFWLCIALIYLYETVEWILAQLIHWNVLNEPRPGDTILGDPLMGMLGIGFVAQLIFVFRQQKMFVALSFWPRALVFILQAGTSVAIDLHFGAFRYGLIIFGTVYLLSGALGYYFMLRHNKSTSNRTIECVVGWLLFATLLIIAALLPLAPPTGHFSALSSVFIRMLYVAGAMFVLLLPFTLYTYLTKQQQRRRLIQDNE